jgi:pre-mRNA-splicing factor CWC22
MFYSLKVAIGLLKDCGKKLTLESPRSLHAIFETLRTILNQKTDLVDDKRIQYMIEVMFAVRKDDFKDYPVCLKELDLVEESEQFTHMLSLDEETFDVESALNIFKFDPDYEDNESKYKILKKEILDESDESDSNEESGDEDEDDDDDEDDENDEAKEKKVFIKILLD